MKYLVLFLLLSGCTQSNSQPARNTIYDIQLYRYFDDAAQVVCYKQRTTSDISCVHIPNYQLYRQATGL